MELKQIKELMTAMERAGIKKLSIKEKTGYELHLERHEEPSLSPAPVSYAPLSHPPLHSHSPHLFPPVRDAASVGAQRVHGEEKVTEEVKAGKYVTSPMVGTFYASSSPDDPAIVKVGDTVDENTVLCIIEAMKVMNEVKAGVSGTVAEILVSNAHPVEFGTKLFRVL